MNSRVCLTVNMNHSNCPFAVGDGNQETKEVHYSNLWRIVRFCENKTDCRRSLQLNYFGELFKRENCLADPDTACDNCLQMVSVPLLYVISTIHVSSLHFSSFSFSLRIPTKCTM